MTNVIKSDLYKLFRTKSFYICGLIAAVLSAIGVLLTPNAIKLMYGIEMTYSELKELGFNGLQVIRDGIGVISLLLTIMVSIFISSEFSFGTMKNIASKGISRTSIYLSKLTTIAFSTIAYMLLCGGVAFAIGTILWGPGEFNKEVWQNLFRMLGLFLFAQIAFQSIFVMLGFLIRHTGGVVATNLAITLIFPQTIIKLIQFCVNQIFKDKAIFVDDYWVGTYLTSFGTMEQIFKQTLETGIIVCFSYLVLSTVIGIINFNLRDIK